MRPLSCGAMSAEGYTSAAEAVACAAVVTGTVSSEKSIVNIN